MIKIPEDEIRRRIQEWRNYKNILYPGLKERSERMRAELKEVKAENVRLQKENQQIEKLLLELEELRALKFGKKRANMKVRVSSLPETADKRGGKKKKERSAVSYRRPEPDPGQITDHLRMELEACHECGEALTDKKEHIHYREDLYEAEELIKSAKKIVETIIESGKCPSCGKRQFAMEVPAQKVIIGENIRAMTVYQTVTQGQSYAEVRKGLLHQYGTRISDGEVTNILEGESRLLTPYYNYLTEELEKESAEEGAHYDETTWKTESRGREIREGNYCRVKIGVKSQKRLIWFGRSRGKKVAETMRGDKKGSKGITDDYGAYKNCFEHHGLCWSHPQRKLRDLAGSGNLSGKRKKICKKTYKNFSGVYKKAEKARQKLLAEAWTEEKKAEERTKLEKLFEALFDPSPNDPERLKTIRAGLKERKDRYFTFFDHPSLPLDNNKAERAIRKIVLKRKKSFGCKSQEGADVLSILYSVIFSLMETYPDENFFTLYKKVKDFDETREITIS